MKALVIGGTGFIGRRLVANLIRNNVDITVGTRGNTPNLFGDYVKMVKIDRFDQESLSMTAQNLGHVDVVFDQVGFGPEDMEKTLTAFTDRTDLYVYTSSSAVYDKKGTNITEGDFDASSHDLKEGGIGNLGYSEGKRSAEAYLVRNADFPFAAVRFPIVVGHDDVTGRAQFHLDRIRTGDDIVVPKPCGRMNYVWVEDAGRFLSWIGMNRKRGPYNAASPEMIEANGIVEMFGNALGRDSRITEQGEKSSVSPYYTKEDRVVSVKKAEDEGFSFTPMKDWAKEVVKRYTDSGGKQINTMDYLRNKSSSS